MWTPYRMMIKQLTGVHAYSFGDLAVGRLRRIRVIPTLIAAVLLTTACDKSSTSAPQKPPGPEESAAPQGPPQAQQTATPDQPNMPWAMSRYTNAKNGFAIDFPVSWKLEKDPDGLFAIQASSPQEHPQDAFSENVYVMVRDMPEVMVEGSPKHLSLNDYFDLSRANFPKISNDAVEQGIGQIAVNEQICPWVIFTHVYNKTTWKTIRYYLRHEQKVFVIVCTATPESFQKYHETFEHIANSITFE